MASFYATCRTSHYFWGFWWISNSCSPRHIKRFWFDPVFMRFLWFNQRKIILKGYWNLDIKVRCNSPSIHQFYILDWQRGREIIVQGTVKYCTVYICMLWSIFNVLNWNWYKVRFSWRSSKLQRGGCRQRSPWTFCVGLKRGGISIMIISIIC